MPGTLTRWEPFAELGELRSRFDRIFGALADGHERAWAPAILLPVEPEKQRVEITPSATRNPDA